MSEIIHNPEVNADLLSRGMRFILDTFGKPLISWDSIREGDIVIIPAFGTSLENKKKLDDLGVRYESYNATCPFVEKVWNVGNRLSQKGFTILIHGKYKHEETTATFSHISKTTKALVLRDLNEANALIDIMKGGATEDDFFKLFGHKCSPNFDIYKDLEKIAIVNQTTMLADETEAIIQTFARAFEDMHGKNQLNSYFANTRNTLCYATNDNQRAISEALKEPADLALVIGGYNSSNTTNIAKMCEQHVKTYFIKSEENIVSRTTISHYDLSLCEEVISKNFLPENKEMKIITTAGASCPDSVIERVIQKLASLLE